MGNAIQLHRSESITPFEPTSLEQAMTLAEMLAKSALVPQAVRNKPADIFVILATGRELGIGPMQALSDINVIQGKPVFSADLMVAQCKKHPEVCKYIRLVESTDKGATYETMRVGAPEPERFTFTMDDARKLGLDGKDNYKKQPKTMLRRRAAAALARETYPDLVRGYDPDEAEDFRQPATVAPPPPAQRLPPASQPVTVDVDPVETPAEDEAPASLEERIRTAPTLEALRALVPEIQKMPSETQASLRPAYSARMKELAS